ncbi:DeoR/GlpR family DNA-binding transcription regulator [Paenibacillus sacheonensis]|uniref:DeoR family transcriptional regulator n=1 Tax=Paenibacillus sacheonensis TaxID=742054 RepID=A0A7X4YS23_9BACL|nr:DeoR/GlpR family DNA-binding transcription regulator [Paenibacillus sacheonensis]MBM7566325.1 DeoR/GlpR family transcriptional regulator of sugar metabolism [Paenibacillus sacheonensis]NBC70529.1 DeoR family transcriptional regulator [Paenibacillus sacheonensis]
MNQQQDTSGLFAEERRERILALLEQEKRVLAKDLADKYQISIDTIRRDLSIMEKQGLLKKTHGGAISSRKVRQAPRPPEIRYGEGSPQGNAITKLAAAYLRENDTVFIGSGAISYLLVKYLPDRMPLTIVTNSIRVADMLREREWIETYLIGGRVKSSGNITDVIANEFIRQFKFDISFVTGSGISEEGIFVSTPEVAAFGRAVAAASRRRIGITTHRSLGNDGFAKAGLIEDLDVLVTDWDADPEAIERIQALGVKVVVAQDEEEHHDHE